LSGLATCFVSGDLAHNLSKKVGKPLILRAQEKRELYFCPCSLT